MKVQVHETLKYPCFHCECFDTDTKYLINFTTVYSQLYFLIVSKQDCTVVIYLQYFKNYFNLCHNFKTFSGKISEAQNCNTRKKNNKQKTWVVKTCLCSPFCITFPVFFIWFSLDKSVKSLENSRYFFQLRKLLVKKRNSDKCVYFCGLLLFTLQQANCVVWKFSHLDLQS